ncbi:uncharacterized protein SPPG_06648 [Spizellomyces punctatus DAOM BR117]|uniref:C2H2-type domain-containing protein n=1 Tax=Spizellomyces punctatus (strain DAOM BR117) TaxID=645134 RepID=A0A0L0HBK0_SPIPD|nr:uncharacterized protein SPPG_06648 [Spizellomyces punctatus DAOM BR117]KNC98249.1 hypothetical protein SPPG_06648 [Spizellomyces punctatus DAOM BR117]|eukprot:XP_016606289.1 hypothetical protein SPPG_06648 [Spizellomyces punctatus DAOM BR117]
MEHQEELQDGRRRTLTHVQAYCHERQQPQQQQQQQLLQQPGGSMLPRAYVYAYPPPAPPPSSSFLKRSHSLPTISTTFAVPPLSAPRSGYPFAPMQRTDVEWRFVNQTSASFQDTHHQESLVWPVYSSARTLGVGWGGVPPTVSGERIQNEYFGRYPVGEYEEATPGEQVKKECSGQYSVHSDSTTHIRYSGNLPREVPRDQVADPSEDAPEEREFIEEYPLHPDSPPHMRGSSPPPAPIASASPTNSTSSSNSKDTETPVRSSPTTRDEVLASLAKKRYACTWEGCEKTFSTSGHLSRHNRIHLNLRPYICPMDGCGMAFTRQDNMRAVS